MSSSRLRWARPLTGAAVLGAVGWRLGAGPFLTGIRAVDARALLAAFVLTFAATVCSAWRWQLVAGPLGLHIPMRTAVAAYYRSQFLNTVLPGGVVGDVHRGLRQGRGAGSVASGLRSVMWERIAGQVAQFLVIGPVLVALPSPVPWARPVAAAVIAAGAVTGWFVLRAGVLERRSLAGIAASSAAVGACHTATFVVAARTAGADVPVARLVTLALLVLLAAAVPTNIGGWGPREGAAAWLFAAAGLGAASGVSAATVFGVMVAVATLPGGVRLALDAVSRRAPRRRPLPPGDAAHA